MQALELCPYLPSILKYTYVPLSQASGIKIFNIILE
jgi:hypothetical protein